MGSNDLWRRLARIAGRQLGLFTTAQAEALGIPRTTLNWWVRTGRIERRYRGVYAIAGVADTWEHRCLAAVLAAGPDALVGGEAAAYLHGLVNAQRGTIELLSTRRATGLGDVVVRTTGYLPDEHRDHVGAVPVTSVTRTLVDLATTWGLRDLRLATIEAWRLRRTDPAALARCCGELGRKRGVTRLNRVLEHCDPRLTRTRALSEIAAFLALADAEVPLPEVNRNVRVAGRTYEIDLAYPALRLGWEVDGRTYHTVEPDAAKDREKDRALASAGWRIERVPASDVLDRPDAFAARVRDALGRAGALDRARRSG